MMHIIKKKIIMTEELKSRITLACSFNNIEPKIMEGNLRIVQRTNLAYVEPHRVIIKGITFLAFNYSKTLYIGNLSNSIEIKDLEDYIKKLKQLFKYQLQLILLFPIQGIDKS